MNVLCVSLNGSKMMSLLPVARRAALAAVSLSFAFAAMPASAQTDVESLTYRLDRLERDLQDVQREVYSNYSGRQQGEEGAAPAPLAGGQPVDNAARLSVRMTELEDSIRNLTGQLEELNFRITRIEQNMQTLSGDVDYRLNTTEQALGLSSVGSAGTPSGTTSSSSSPSSGDVTTGSDEFNSTVRTADEPQTLGTLSGSQLPGTAGELYDTAKQRLLAGDYAGAQLAFEKFLNDYGDDELAGEAQYWLGEALFVQQAYREAGRAFATGLEKYPNSPRGPETLLKLGMSLAAVQETDAACTTFGELDQRYPNASQAIVQRVKVEKDKAGCF